MVEIKPGDTVEWRSQAAGSWKTKKGKVIAYVPAGQSAYIVQRGGDMIITRRGQNT